MSATPLLYRQQTSLSSAIGIAKGLNALATAAIALPGSGYIVGEILTVSGGTAVVATRLRVDAVNGLGAITRFTIERYGIYTANPSNDVSVTSNLAGTGATFTLTYNADSVPVQARWALVEAITQDVYWRDDGTAPTSTTGQLLKANDTLTLDGKQMRAAQFIEATASAKLNVTFYTN